MLLYVQISYPDVNLLRSRSGLQVKLPWWCIPQKTEPPSWHGKIQCRASSCLVNLQILLIDAAGPRYQHMSLGVQSQVGSCKSDQSHQSEAVWTTCGNIYTAVGTIMCTTQLTVRVSRSMFSFVCQQSWPPWLTPRDHFRKRFTVLQIYTRLFFSQLIEIEDIKKGSVCVRMISVM